MKSNPLFFRYLLRVIIVVFAIIGFILTTGYLATRLGITNTKGIVDVQSKNFIPQNKEANTYELFPLAHSPEWVAFKQAVAKDKIMIRSISKETGISERLLVAILVPEQMRLFHSERAVFKQIFEPLKILGSQSQFSWGIFGIKDDTALQIETNLHDTSSPYYLGKAFEQSLSFSTSDIDQERFARIIDEHNHLYAYKYTALYVAQIQKAWSKAGYPINNMPEIIATLWNLGFTKSKPHKNPLSGGSVIIINDKSYSFGELARLFYYSDELIEIFPK